MNTGSLRGAQTPRCHCEEREARRGNLYQPPERPALFSLIPNALPSVIRFAAKIRRNSARLLIPLQLCCERNGRSHCEERAARRGNLYKTRNAHFYTEIGNTGR
jgi:hypothetical protein